MDDLIKNARVARTAFKVFTSFAEADAEARAYWHSRTPQERLIALELMRQIAYGYDSENIPAFQRIIEIVPLNKN
ncbi:MAG: hypothetical protein NVSMB56_02560 [Pyrinomonadaceae bacterium]